MNDIPQCRICLEENKDKSRFIVPCLCTGSSKYVHRNCLDEWRSQNPNGDNFKRCNTCKFNYEIIEIDQDPILEKRRQRAYNKAIRLSIISVIFYIIILVLMVTLLIYFCDYVEISNIHDKFYYYIPGPSILVYTIAGIVGLLLIFAFIGLASMFYGAFSVIAESGPMGMFSLFNPVNIVVCVLAGIVIGIVAAFVTVCRYLDSERRFHRQKIWLRREAAIKQVRDFGERGPPQAPPPPEEVDV
jgi:hypothetical protein